MEQASYSWTVRARVSNQARELGSLTLEKGNVPQDHLFQDAAKYTVMVNMAPTFPKNNLTYADSAALRNSLSTAGGAIIPAIWEHPRQRQQGS